MPPTDSRELALLIHGLGGHRLGMMALAWRLRQSGFRTRFWPYYSWTRSIEHHGGRLREFLDETLAREPVLHVVAHSMGSIVVRQACLGSPIAGLGRMVFLAPPNRGSPWATTLSRLVGGRIRTLSQITTRPDSFVHGLPPWQGVEAGVIAARFDATVPPSCTRLEGAAEPIVLPTTHNGLLFSARAARLVARFLRTGRFDAAETL